MAEKAHAPIGPAGLEVAHEFFGEAGGEASAAMAREASLIIGMHPDEVTETIVDTALAAGKADDLRCHY